MSDYVNCFKQNGTMCEIHDLRIAPNANDSGKALVVNAQGELEFGSVASKMYLHEIQPYASAGYPVGYPVYLITTTSTELTSLSLVNAELNKMGTKMSRCLVGNASAGNKNPISATFNMSADTITYVCVDNEGTITTETPDNIASIHDSIMAL